MTQYTHRHYVKDESFLEKYSKYQQRYAEEPRESDKTLIRMITEFIQDRPATNEQVSLLDIGCSTGNLLRHLRAAFPELKLTGGDAAGSLIESCQQCEDLQGIDFEVMDMLALDFSNRFDFIVANAVTYLFEDDEYERALAGVCQALRPGGCYLSFEWIHPFKQEIKIIEKSDSHSNGLPIHARSAHRVQRVSQECGFVDSTVTPFEIPVDLDRATNKTDDAGAFENLNTYTLKTDSGQRLLFRGALYQPWSHFRAFKAA